MSLLILIKKLNPVFFRFFLKQQDTFNQLAMLILVVSVVTVVSGCI